MSDTYISTVEGCQRCGGLHPEMEFHPLLNAIDEWRWWAICPATGQPILMAVPPYANVAFDSAMFDSIQVRNAERRKLKEAAKEFAEPGPPQDDPYWRSLEYKKQVAANAEFFQRALTDPVEDDIDYLLGLAARAMLSAGSGVVD